MIKKIPIIFLFVSIIIFFLSFGCKVIEDVENLIGEKDYGNYTSITIRITVAYKGLNSTGIRKLTIGNEVKVNENYSFGGTATMGSTCEDAILDKTFSFDITITTTSLPVKQEYFDWDYLKFATNKTNVKMLCTEWSGSIVSYLYVSGKDDPGSPVIDGFDALNGFNVDDHCQKDGVRRHDCETSVDLSFSSPHTTKSTTATRTTAVSVKKEWTNISNSK